MVRRATTTVLLLAVAFVCVSNTGCQVLHPGANVVIAHSPIDPPVDTAKELAKTVLPDYRIEPPDILLLDATHIIPRQPYKLRTFDAIEITALGTPQEAPIDGVYQVEPGGLVKFGQFYGSVPVAGMTVDEAKMAIEAQLKKTLKDPMVSVSLEEMSSLQQIAGEHLVAQDGTVNLGIYGGVRVVGMTIAEAKTTIETHLSEFLEDPEVSVDVFAYNSQKYYVVMQGAGFGDVVQSFPITGNETVLDALALMNGTQNFSSKRMWIARPATCGTECQILPVDWKSITALASTGTNYQILPGDRVFIAEDRNVAFDTWVGKVLSPWERLMGFSLLGVQTATRFTGPVLQGGGNPRGQGGF